MGHAMAVTLGMLVLCAAALAQEAERVGERPYELEWANRKEDEHQPLMDFERLDGWRVVTQDAEAAFERTRQQQIWGAHVGKLTYRGTGPQPLVKVLPPAPIAIGGPFDAVTCWIYGNNWGWAPKPDTPQVNVAVLLEDAAKQEFSVPLARVNWTEWFLCHERLTPEQVKRVAGGAAFKGFAISGGHNQQDRVLYFDNLAFFTEEFKPLAFKPRPERGIPMFPGQGVGTNTGPGQLPFPTRRETILPDNLTQEFKTTVAQDGDAFVFTYAGADGKLAYRLEPKTGTLTDVSAQWAGRGEVFRPCVGGGVVPTDGAVEAAEHLGTALKDQVVESRWRLKTKNTTVEVAYTYRLWAKSLVVDVVAPGGGVSEVRYGKATGLPNPRLVTLPYYHYGSTRPAIVVAGPPDAPLFLAGHTDWYLSNASAPWAANAVTADGVAYNGGTRYVAKTDGKRNDCYERFFITVSPRFEEVLPNIPNPVSPWKEVAGTRVWRAHGANADRQHDYRHWRECHRYGMTQIAVTDHETMWRDGGESFTFRTRAAPKKGGDEAQAAYSKFMREELGFVYGPYNNFTDFAPVNEHWNTDMVSRTPENQLQNAWMRCYAPKPARAVEYCALLAPQIQQKFHFSTAYCDVHTAVQPWDRVDYDWRVPGAGTFGAVFYSFGEIMLLQKAAWNGPVYSEGNAHFPYCGLADGNYAQDQRYRIPTRPWLVDFDLRKMHDLCCNFGMGNPEMFYGHGAKDPTYDRFLAATVAFGHPGFLVYEGGLPTALRSYYMLQQLHARYTQASVAEIRYADANGKLHDTSAAVASGVYERSQIVTKYASGCITVVNGNQTEPMLVEAYGRKLDLPPNGYAGWTENGAVEVFSGEPSSATGRADYAATPAYLYVDGRGAFARFAKAAGNGIGICRILPEGKHEIIPYGGAECGFAIPPAKAVALDKECKELGPAELRVARGLTYVVPVKGAFSYLLNPAPVDSGAKLACARDEVVAGERVVVRGKDEHAFQIPADAKPGTRIWLTFEEAWIDFTVVPLADAAVALDGDTLRVMITSHLAKAEQFEISLAQEKRALDFEPGKATAVVFDLGKPAGEKEETLALAVRAGDMRMAIERRVRTTQAYAPATALPGRYQTGMCLRGKKEQYEFGTTGGAVHAEAATSGGVTKQGLTMHPPYVGGVGYAFAEYEAVALPSEPKAAFRAMVGKRDGSHPGDGILYRVVVADADGAERVAAAVTVTKHEWLPIKADLSPWAGKNVRLRLVADVGPKDNSSGDWACWAEMRIVTRERQLIRTLLQPPASADKRR